MSAFQPSSGAHPLFIKEAEKLKAKVDSLISKIQQDEHFSPSREEIGKHAKTLIDLMNQTNARLFVLDCQPNLYDQKIYPAAEIEKRITSAVQSLKEKHPHTPILLVEHSSGLAQVNLDNELTRKYIWTSEILKNTYQKLQQSGIKDLYILTAKEIGFNDNSTIDGTHPNDFGMMQYADAYEKVIRKILALKK